MCFFILCAWEILAKNSHLNSLGLLNEKMIYTRLLFVVNQNIKLKKICPIHTKAICSHSLWLWFTASKIMPFFSLLLMSHSLEIRGLCLIKWPSETFKILPYLWNMKTQVVLFSYFILCYFIFSLKNKVAQNEKWKKNTWVFVFQKYGKFWSILLASSHQA